VRDDHFTSTEADAGLYERQRAMDDYDPPDVERDEPCTCGQISGWQPDCPQHGAWLRD